jgi:hypothetical protein
MRILRAAGCHILRKTAAQVELKPVLCGLCPDFFLGGAIDVRRATIMSLVRLMSSNRKRGAQRCNGGSGVERPPLPVKIDNANRTAILD